MNTTTTKKKYHRDTVRRGPVNDYGFEEGDRVRVRLSPTTFGVGVILSKPAWNRPLYEVEVEVDGRCVEASWFHIHHYHDDEILA